MTVSAETLRLLMAAGLAGEELLAVVESIDRTEQPAKVSAGAERTRRWREKKADASRGDVTVTHHGDVTQPPKTKVSPTPLSKTQTSTPSPPKGGSVPTNLAFERFWRAYPRKVGKSEARKAFAKALLKLGGDGEQVLVGSLERAKAAWTDPQFIPHASRWLNAERWEDEPEQPRPQELSPFAKWQIATGRA